MVFGILVVLLTVAAETRQLEKVAPYVEPCKQRHPELEVLKITLGKVDHSAALCTHQMMVVLTGSRGHVRGRAAPRVDLADPAHVKEYVERTVDGGKTNAGILSMGSLVYFGGGQMVVTADNDIQHNLALRCQFISTGLEGR